MDMHVNGCPQLADVDGVGEVRGAGWLESRDGAPPVLSWFARLAVEVAAAESDGIRVDIRGAAELLRPREPAPVVRQVSEKVEQDVGRRHDAGAIELMPLPISHA